jgi:hypothetical protein
MKARRFLIENRSVVLPFFVTLVMILSCGRTAKMPVPPPPPLSQKMAINIPSFPWPPPQASATEIIPNALIVSKTGVTRLRDVDERITNVLNDNGWLCCTNIDPLP